MKILHIIPDDKFWESPIQLFSTLKVSNEYICFVDNDFVSYKYIKTQSIQPVYISDSDSICKRDDVDVFMFHSMPPMLYKIICAIPLNKIVITSTWGYDIYCELFGISPIIPITLYKRKTFNLLNGNFLIRSIKNVYHFYKSHTDKSYLDRVRQTESEVRQYKKNQIECVKRIDYWATVLPYEYELLSTVEGFKAKYFPFQYVGNNTYAYDVIDFNNADCIIVGNSADPTNNHLDLLTLIRKKHITNSLYLPMAYGDAAYAENVQSFIKKNGIKAFIQRDFMPYEQYIKRLKSCRVGIFGHIRQQAIGNINACLLQGCKVFLYKDSIAYKYYKGQGYIIFCIEDDLNQESINTSLTKEQIETNLQKMSFWGFDNVRKRVELSVSEIEHLC